MDIETIVILISVIVILTIVIGGLFILLLKRRNIRVASAFGDHGYGWSQIPDCFVVVEKPIGTVRHIFYVRINGYDHYNHLCGFSSAEGIYLEPARVFGIRVFMLKDVAVFIPWNRVLKAKKIWTMQGRMVECEVDSQPPLTIALKSKYVSGHVQLMT